MEKVLVTGVSGFLGHNCALELIKNGYYVKGSVRDLNKKSEVLNGLKKEVDISEKLEFVKLDLLSDDGWEDAVEDCKYVLHVAAPFSVKEPKSENEYIEPIVDGTMRALKFSKKAKVKRIVLTSSAVTMMGVVYASKKDTGMVDSNDWTDPNSKNINTYIKAKTLGEKAAWEFYNNQSDDSFIEMAVMCAGGIYGPSLTGNISGFSLKGVHQMLTGHFKMLMIPPAGIPMSDVRDLAKLHVLAMTEKKANGKRLIPTTSRAYSFMDIAKILKKNGYNKVSTKKAPIFMIKLMSLFDMEAKGMEPIVGNTVSSNNTETKEIFNWEPTSFEKTILDCAKSIEHLI
tara:strand:- start:334 stop:1362 length:1029 start_codon:yes stop_codon:yes gene_type:complete